MSGLAATAALRTRVTLERPDDTTDDTGALVRVWTPVADLWAKIGPRRGAETFFAGEQETALTHEVIVRWRPEVESPLRFRIGARALYIRAAFDPDARRRRLVCICEEFAA